MVTLRVKRLYCTIIRAFLKLLNSFLLHNNKLNVILYFTRYRLIGNIMKKICIIKISVKMLFLLWFIIANDSYTAQELYFPNEVLRLINQQLGNNAKDDFSYLYSRNYINEEDRLSTLENFLRNHINVDAQDNLGNTLLHYWYHLPILKNLLEELGASKEILNNNNEFANGVRRYEINHLPNHLSAIIPDYHINNNSSIIVDMPPYGR